MCNFEFFPTSEQIAASTRLRTDSTGGHAVQPRPHRSADAGAEKCRGGSKIRHSVVARLSSRAPREPPDGLQYDKRNRAPITKALRKYSELLYKSPRLGCLPVSVVFGQNVARWNGISHRLILGTAVTPPLRKGRGARALPLCLGSAAMCSERALGPVDFRLGWVAGFRTIPWLRAEDPTALPLSVTHFLWMVILRRHYVTLPLHTTTPGPHTISTRV